MRRDPSGELRQGFRGLIDEGSQLQRRLCTAGEPEREGLLRQLERWRLRAVALVGSVFEREAVEEIARATSPARGGRGHAARVKDALELLSALEGTLDGHGASAAPERAAQARRQRTAGA